MAHEGTRILAASKQQNPEEQVHPKRKSPAFSLFPSTPSRVKNHRQVPIDKPAALKYIACYVIACSASFAPGPENDAHDLRF